MPAWQPALPAPAATAAPMPVAAVTTTPAAAPPAPAARPAPRRAKDTTAATALAADNAVTTPPAAAAPGAGWDVNASGDDNQAPHQPGFQAVQAPPPAPPTPSERGRSRPHTRARDALARLTMINSAATLLITKAAATSRVSPRVSTSPMIMDQRAKTSAWVPPETAIA